MGITIIMDIMITLMPLVIDTDMEAMDTIGRNFAQNKNRSGRGLSGFYCYSSSPVFSMVICSTSIPSPVIRMTSLSIFRNSWFDLLK